MDRADATGLGIAFAGHAALFAILSLGLAKASLPPIQTEPMEVEFVEDLGLVSAAPTPSAAEPATRLGEPEPLPLPDPLPPAPPQVEPLPQPKVAPVPPPRQPVPRAQPQPKVAPQPKASPPRQKTAPQPKSAARPSGRLSGLLDGVRDRESPSRSTARPATTAGPAVQASLIADIRRQIRPHWQRAAPSGADVEKLRTEVTISLSRSGAVTDVSLGDTTGVTGSNRPQVALHRERSVRAVRLAGPYQLPEQFYDAWKQITITLDLRLAQ